MKTTAIEKLIEYAEDFPPEEDNGITGETASVGQEARAELNDIIGQLHHYEAAVEMLEQELAEKDELLYSAHGFLSLCVPFMEHYKLNHRGAKDLIEKIQAALKGLK